ncbi:hypothetical protein I4F81_010578 [Pyropia yezoensis]|uniref:Uncharacterized protein n=1 Tax=Pyropia yezoensis TaxID=2788 RepID=A0ACC3CD38_PYRYE|nr:hypothetical protein I4F81_010578 [Neopyropia yezoensis]
MADESRGASTRRGGDPLLCFSCSFSLSLCPACPISAENSPTAGRRGGWWGGGEGSAARRRPPLGPPQAPLRGTSPAAGAWGARRPPLSPPPPHPPHALSPPCVWGPSRAAVPALADGAHQELRSRGTPPAAASSRVRQPPAVRGRPPLPRAVGVSLGGGSGFRGGGGAAVGIYAWPAIAGRRDPPAGAADQRGRRRPAGAPPTSGGTADQRGRRRPAGEPPTTSGSCADRPTPGVAPPVGRAPPTAAAAGKLCIWKVVCWWCAGGRGGRRPLAAESGAGGREGDGGGGRRRLAAVQGRTTLGTICVHSIRYIRSLLGAPLACVVGEGGWGLVAIS